MFSVNNYRKDRFSLLLLEPGERHCSDFAAEYWLSSVSNELAPNNRVKGRLRICSKSLIFEAQDRDMQMIKILFQDVTQIFENSSQRLKQLEPGKEMQLFSIHAFRTIRMNDRNTTAPYVFDKLENYHYFNLLYTNVAAHLPLLCQLHALSRFPLAEQDVELAVILKEIYKDNHFDKSLLDDFYDTVVMEMFAERVLPLVNCPGSLLLTASRLYFQPFSGLGPVLKVKLNSLQRIQKRRYAFKNVGLELICNDKTLQSFCLRLESEELQNELYKKIVNLSGVVEGGDHSLETVTHDWQQRKISNFEYLSILNGLADRSVNDLAQYPVFPWTISDYSSTELDLTDELTFRDLSKPIGALNDERLQRILTRYREMPEPKFMYGSHYSTPSYVLYYLSRSAPELVLCLQGGKFDQPDRMFNSISAAWNSCLQGPSDFRELIPEFYDSNGDFLLNKNLVNFGKCQNGQSVGDVELPPWAQGSPALFVKKMREALESDFVSAHLHEWIDLIFGYKQRGIEAEKAYNVFFHLTYDSNSSADCESSSEASQAAIESQIMEYGQTPRQLFTQPHPCRYGNNRVSVSTEPAVVNGVCSNVVASAISGSTHQAAWLTDLSLSHEYALHKSIVTKVLWTTDRNVISTSLDSLLKIYSVDQQQVIRSLSFSNMPLSSCLLLNNQTAIIGSWDNYLYVCDLERGRVLSSVHAHEDAVSGMAVQQGLLFSSSWDSMVKMWTVRGQEDNAAQLLFKGELDHESAVTCVAATYDANLVASGKYGGGVCMWDVATQQPLLHLSGHAKDVCDVVISNDGRTVVSCGEDSLIHWYDVQSGVIAHTLTCSSPVRCLQWTSRCIFSGCDDGTVMCYDVLQPHKPLITYKLAGAVHCLSLSADKKQLAMGGNKTVSILA